MDITLSCSPLMTLEPDQGRPRRFSGIAYSGGVISYGPLGDVAIDLSSLHLPTKRLFALVNHDPNQRAGTITLSASNDSILVDGEFMDTPAGQSVASEFQQGAPWEFSVMVQGKKQRVDRAQPTRLNGRDLSIDLMISDALIREVSFVPAGADPNTTAIAFSMEDSMDHPTEPTIPVEAQQPELVGTNLEFKLSTLTTENELLMKSAAQYLEERNTLQLQLSAITAERDTLRSELDAIAQAKREGDVRVLLATLKRDYTDETARPYLIMPDDAFAILKADITSLATSLDTPAPTLEASLTVEQAKEGSVLPSDPLERAVAELRLAHPTLTMEQATARVLHVHPELYVSAV